MFYMEIEEKQYSGTSMYEISRVIDNHKTLVKKVMYSTHTTTIDGNTFFTLYDYDMNIMERVFKYINFNPKMKRQSLNSKLQYVYSIALLYAFCDIFELDINEMKEENITAFEYFLSGQSDTTSMDKHILLTSKRTQTSISKIMNNCKNYIKAQRWKNHELFVCSKATKAASKNYNKVVPRFITPDEYDKIIDFIYDSESFTEEQQLKYTSMFSLMFNFGLRIGEVLGLTLEDLIPSLTSGVGVPVVILRNRVSDDRHQNAKTCMNVHSKRDYFNPDYKNTKGYGYQTVNINEELYHDIQEYVDLSYERMKYYKSFKNNSADSVTGKFEDNRYIFLNDNVGSHQNYELLRQRVRYVFENCGIDTDMDVKTNNLNHRFRHGFVMKLLYIDNMPANLVIQYTRHTSVAGLEPYNNPTDEYLVRKLKEFNEKNNGDILL